MSLRRVRTELAAVALVAALAGCESAQLAGTSAPTLAPNTPTATAPVTPSAALPFSQSALVVQANPDSQGASLSAVDPATGAVLRGHVPLNVGDNFVYRFTPDRQTLIYAIYHISDSSQPALHFLDLPTWHDESIILLPFSTSASALAISPDGTRFVIATLEARASSLWLVDVLQHKVLAHTRTSNLVIRMQFTADSEHLMLYERQESTKSGLSKGPPNVELLSAQDLDPVWSRILAAVRDGFVPNPGSGGDPNAPGDGSIYRPAVVFAPKADLLYLVHADVGKLTRVDFSRRSVLTLDIRPAVSWFGQILAQSATTAYAKGQDGIERQAVISPDGKILYTVGLQSTVSKKSNGTWEFSQTSLKLEAIEAATSTQLFDSDIAGDDLDLSIDGARVFVHQWNHQNGYFSGTAEVDGITGQLIAQRPGLAIHSTRRMDGTPLLVSSVAGNTDQPIYTLAAMDASLHLLGQWDVPQYADWLLVP